MERRSEGVCGEEELFRLGGVRGGGRGRGRVGGRGGGHGCWCGGVEGVCVWRV